MFRTSATFDYADAFRIERVLERCGWTDVVRICVDSQLVYEDTVGLGADLVAALDEVRAHLLDRHTPFVVVVARVEGSRVTVCRVACNALLVTWDAHTHDAAFDRSEDESTATWEARVRGSVAGGALADVAAEVGAWWKAEVAQAEAAGLHVRADTVRGPWLELRGTAPEDRFGELHRSYAGAAPPLATERLILDQLLSDPAAPDLSVRVDHLGERVPLPDLSDQLVALAIPAPRYPPDPDEESLP